MDKVKDSNRGYSVPKRIFAALTAAACAVAFFLWCPLYVLPAVLAVFSALAQLEFYKMAAIGGYPSSPRFGIMLGTVWIAATAASPGFGGFFTCVSLGACVMPFAIFAFGAYLVMRSSRERPLSVLAVTTLGVFYVPFLLSFFLRTVQFDAGAQGFAPDSRVGLYTLFALIASAKASDMGGVAFGLSFGRHKMCPSVSPKKSWEGFAGSVIGAVAVVLAFRFAAMRGEWALDCPLWDHVTVPVAVAAGAAIAVCGTFGDLVESRLKRDCGVKDSSVFLPAGMGGLLDMLDSLLFLPALLYPVLMATCNR